ncbi:MAG: hypothetical protein N4A47_03880 [Clostridia bacterium]|jgi:hypothetical protein|nr:hypothetical protein [Clostridia bacterium]
MEVMINGITIEYTESADPKDARFRKIGEGYQKLDPDNPFNKYVVAEGMMTYLDFVIGTSRISFNKEYYPDAVILETVTADKVAMHFCGLDVERDEEFEKLLNQLNRSNRVDDMSMSRDVIGIEIDKDLDF